MEEKLYFGELAGLSEEQVIVETASQFCVDEETLKQYNFIIADIDHQDYEGSALKRMMVYEANTLCVL